MVSNVGVYIRGLSVNRQGTPKAAAKKAKDHGVSFVPILAIWQNKDNTLFSNGRGADLIIKYAEAFKAAGIDPWIWGYPWAGKHTEYVDRMSAVTEKCGGTIAGWLHDPELGFKWGKGLTSADVRAAALSFKIRCGLELPQAVTSYAAIAGHKNFPWHEFSGWGWGSPQLYTVGAEAVDNGIRQWKDNGWTDIRPSVPLYGKNSGENLHDYLSLFVDGEENINGLVFWSWRQGSKREWETIDRWSRWLESGMCVV